MALVVFASLLIYIGCTSGIPALALASGVYSAGGTDEPCAPSLSASECQLRRAECGVVNSILQASGGPINSVLECAEMVGVPVHPASLLPWVRSGIWNPVSEVFLGTSYLTGNPPSILDQIGADSTSLAALRYCTLNATGLVMENGKIDRVELSERFETQLFYMPSVSSALIEAAGLCPEPEEYKVETFLGCLRASCLQAGVSLPLSAEDLNLTPKRDLTLAALPTSVPLDNAYWMM
ncbi:uncharacterized protein [Macrobrachium rosenbergii]|uniref:uncharacterized protein n=1 Tax=Macrobrachium rosenbergii TaxID=79674 RepID=UPI0034D5D8D0